ncbi:hypothetical protein [Owenweeksia hongkongensis]|uniref:hypothetical protein n=1 Tax=Owenweeksia hongkongensis TaxID=253245 RepID=UPI003A92DA4B
MKYIFPLLIVFANATLAQVDITSAFNSTYSGRSIILSGSAYLNPKNEIGIGIRYNINKLAHNDDQNNVFLKRQFGTEFKHHWGITAFYHHYIFKDLNCVKPFVFYDFQYSKSPTRNRMFLPAFEDEELGTLYYEVIEYFGPFTWLENNIGVGIKAKITNRLYLNQKIGVGAIFILGKDEKRPITYDNFEWDFAALIQVGLAYRLEK